MKKLSLTLAALLVAGSLVACDKKPANTTPGFGKDVPAEAVPPGTPAPAPAAPASKP